MLMAHADLIRVPLVAYLAVVANSIHCANHYVDDQNQSSHDVQDQIVAFQEDLEGIDIVVEERPRDFEDQQHFETEHVLEKAFLHEHSMERDSVAK
jgi:hypothetical protein